MTVDRIASLVDVDDAPTGWREAGSGDVVLLLHGLGASRTAWDAQLLALGDGWRAVAWDCPGYGVSEPPRRWDLPTLADAAVALLDRLGVRRAHLVGHSFGGMVALHTALDHPDRVDRLVLASTSPAFGLDGTDPEAWVAQRHAALAGDEITTDTAQRILGAVAGPRLDASSFDAAVAALRRVRAGAVRGAMTCVTGHDVRARLDEITSPTLVLVGDEDRETPPSYAAALAEGIPDARVRVVEGAGHLLPFDAVETFSRAVGDFISATPHHTAGER